MTKELLPYLVSLYALICVGNMIISWFVYKGSPSVLNKLLFNYWLGHVITTVINGLTSLTNDPDVIALAIFAWPIIFVAGFKIMEEISPEVKMKFWYKVGACIGMAVTALLLLTDVHFTYATIPAVYSMGIFGLNMCWQFAKANKSRKIFSLEVLFLILMASFMIHMLDFPFLRLNEDTALLGYTYFLFNIVGFSTVLPALALNQAAELRRVELEQLVEDRSQKLIHQSKFSALGEMAAGVAHEINNPLAIIVGRTDQLIKRIEHYDLPENFRHSLVSIEKTAFRISRIVTALKDFSRGDYDEPMQPVTLESLLGEILLFSRERFAQHGIELQVEGDMQTVVNSRGHQLSQVFLNLLNNAFDAVEFSEKKLVSITIEKFNEKIIFSVSDTGLGISAEAAPKIMQPFFTTKDVGKGTGLGLSISRGIMETHKGRLYLEREKNPTIFKVELPNLHH